MSDDGVGCETKIDIFFSIFVLEQLCTERMDESELSIVNLKFDLLNPC